MGIIKRAYVALCRKHGPYGLTLSAYAWKVSQETGNTFWRDRIDGLFLLLCGQHQHCHTQFQRETRD